MATTTSTLSNHVIDAFNKVTQMQFASRSNFARIAIENGRQHENGSNAEKGSPVKFTIYNRLQTSTDSLGETTAGTPADVSASQVSVTLLEKGAFIKSTEKLETLSFVDLQNTYQDLILDNATRSTDQLAMEVAESEVTPAYLTFGQGGQRASKNLIEAADTINSATIRQTFADLQASNAPMVRSEGGEFYLWFVHPHVASDLRSESSGNTFREAKLYANPSEILRGELGAYEGFRFISTSAVKMDFAGGKPKQAATTVDGAHVAGSTTLDVVSATGIVAGNVVNVTVGGVQWALEVTSVSTNELTINRAIRRNGFEYFAQAGSGLPVALAGGEAVLEASAVYTNYAFGADAFAYAYATKPELRVRMDGSDPYGRLQFVSWYAIHNVGILNPEGLRKVYLSSSLNPNG